MNLDPTVGHEIDKSRACLVISLDEIRKLGTITGPTILNAKETLGHDTSGNIRLLLPWGRWGNWSMRDVVSALGVTVNALYRYIEDREDLVVAIGEAATLSRGAYLAKSKGKGEARLIHMA